MKGMKHAQVFIRLTVLGLTLGDLQGAINDRLEAAGKKPINYSMLSRILNGRSTYRREVLGYADDITSRWMTETANEYLRVLTPRLEDSGVCTYDLLAKIRIEGDESPTVHFRNYNTGKTVAVYDITTDKLILQGG